MKGGNKAGVVLASMLLLAGCLDIPNAEVIETRAGTHLGESCRQIPKRDGFPRGLPTEFNTLVWNVYKLQAENWQPELNRLSQGADLLLLQEALDKPALIQLLDRFDWRWQQVVAFRYQERAAGVMNAAKVEPVYNCSLRSVEPASRIPKSAMLELYPLQGSRYPLMVVNIHAINFELGMAAYQQQVAQLAKLTDSYPGPVLFAGDFNAWSDKRTAMIQQIMQQARLKEAAFSPDVRLRFAGWPLDHVFYRGLELVSASTQSSDGSDHNPLLLRFRAEPANTVAK